MQIHTLEPSVACNRACPDHCTSDREARDVSAKTGYMHPMSPTSESERPWGTGCRCIETRWALGSKKRACSGTRFGMGKNDVDACCCTSDRRCTQIRLLATRRLHRSWPTSAGPKFVKQHSTSTVLPPPAAVEPRSLAHPSLSITTPPQHSHHQHHTRRSRHDSPITTPTAPCIGYPRLVQGR
jgi:hypothetical protein